MEHIRIKSPAWRFQQAKKHALQGSNVDDCLYTNEAIKMLKGEECNSYLLESYLLHKLPEANGVLCSLLITDMSLTSIADSIESSEEVVLWFSKLFFDTGVFFNRLLLKEFINILPEKTALQSHFKDLLKASYNLGPGYILWKKGLKGSEGLDPVKVGHSLMEDSYWRAREHKAFNIASNEAKESRAWFPQVIRALDACRNLKDTGETTLETLRLKLVKQDSTKTLGTLNLDDIKG